jgi:hypothetical protein
MVISEYRSSMDTYCYLEDLTFLIASEVLVFNADDLLIEESFLVLLRESFARLARGRFVPEPLTGDTAECTI